MSKKIIFLFIIIALIVLSFFIFMSFHTKPNKEMIFGTSFSPAYARYLGLDAGQVYKTILDDWQFKYLRLSAQWDTIEKKKGEYDFSDLDWYMNEAAKRKAKVTLVVGRKTPRWPECHLPDWAKKVTYQEYRPALLNFMKVAVERYKNHSALEIWQVENEPFLPFGLCKIISQEDLKEEIDLVKKLDSTRQLIVTDSGELSTWRKTAKATDLFGTTMYRVVWNKYIGYFSYNWLPAFFYRAKLLILGRSVETAYIVELQAEPWMPNRELTALPLTEQFKSMDIIHLKNNVIYAQRTGMPRAYLWGAEWWYWIKEKQNRSEFVDYIKTLKKD